MPQTEQFEGFKSVECGVHFLASTKSGTTFQKKSCVALAQCDGALSPLQERKVSD